MDDLGGPVITSSDERTRTWLLVAGGLAGTVALIVAMLAVWPEGGGSPDPAGAPASTTPAVETTTASTAAGSGEPSRTTVPGTAANRAGDDLFHGDLPAAFADLQAAAGDPTQLLEVAVYDRYAFLAYRDPAAPGNVDRRMWSEGEVGAADPNPIDDRVDADTEPRFFSPGDLDLSLVEALVADAPSHYDIPTAVSHILIDRFLPFDERVLIRVYATPTDGRSGGGYVSYDLAGATVRVCC